jgi:DNA-binding MarR family transcriptional regulator
MQATAATTQALAETLQQFVGCCMRGSGNGFLQELDDHELSLTQLKALHMLAARGELSVKQVGECLQLSLPAASRAVDGLVKRRLVERLEDPHDRRSRLVRLAAPGTAVLERVEEARFRGLASFVETLDEAERAALTAALSPIVERLDP